MRTEIHSRRRGTEYVPNKAARNKDNSIKIKGAFGRSARGFRRKFRTAASASPSTHVLLQLKFAIRILGLPGR